MYELLETIAPALEAAAETLRNKGVQLVLDIPRGIVLPLQRSLEFSECSLILFQTRLKRCKAAKSALVPR